MLSQGGQDFGRWSLCEIVSVDQRFRAVHVFRSLDLTFQVSVGNQGWRLIEVALAWLWSIEYGSFLTLIVRSESEEIQRPGDRSG